MSKINRYYPDNVLFIPLFENKDSLYNLNNIYTPRKFINTDEYIIHLENLRKLKNYVNINKHLELLDGHIYKNIIKKKLVNINWHKKIKEKTEEEKNKLIEKINIIKTSENNLNKPNNINNNLNNNLNNNNLNNNLNKNNLDKPNNINNNLNKPNIINNKNNVYKPNIINNKNNVYKPNILNNKNNVYKPNILNNKNNVYNDTLNYKNLKKVNIKKNDIDILRKEFKLPKI